MHLLLPGTETLLACLAVSTARPMSRSPGLGVNMSRVQKLRLFVSQRLNAVLEEIVAVFEKTMVKYEQEAALCQEVISRQHALLCAVHKPLMEVPSADAFTLQLMGSSGPVNPKDQDENQNPTEEQAQGSHVEKKQQGDQLQDLDEAEIIQFTYNPRCAARPGENVDRFQSEPGPTGPAQDVLLVLSSETEDSEDYSKDSVEPRSTTNHLRMTHKPGPFVCRVCSQTFTAHRVFFKHIKAHLLEPDPVCGVCGERFKSSDRLRLHIETHQTRTQSRETRFKQQQSPRIHENKPPTSCEDCGKVRKKRKHRCWAQRKKLDLEILEGSNKT